MRKSTRKSTAIESAGLQGEIDLVRRLIQRVADQLSGEIDLEQTLKMLEKVSQASARLAALLKAQRQFESSASTEDVLRERVQRILSDDEETLRRLKQAGQGLDEEPGGE